MRGHVSCAYATRSVASRHRPAYARLPVTQDPCTRGSDVAAPCPPWRIGSENGFEQPDTKSHEVRSGKLGGVQVPPRQAPVLEPRILNRICLRRLRGPTLLVVKHRGIKRALRRNTSLPQRASLPADMQALRGRRADLSAESPVMHLEWMEGCSTGLNLTRGRA
jgi:hypothetical protein